MKSVKGERLSSTEKSYLEKWVKVGKSAQTGSKEQPAQPPKCPECASQKIWKDGLRYVKTETGDGMAIQRFLCRTCGRRFSECAEPKVTVHISTQPLKTSNPGENDLEKGIIGTNFPFKEGLNSSFLFVGEDVTSHHVSPITTVEKGLNKLPFYNSKHQVCAKESVAKNLRHQRTRQKRATGATKKADVKGKIVEYSWYLKKQGYAEDTITSRTQVIKSLIKLGANLYDPENVKHIMALQDDWSEGYKAQIKYAYENFLQMEGLSWEPPRYKQPETLPFVPLQHDIDQLINACGKKVSIFLQGLKETGTDPGELWRVEWTDVDEKHRTVAIRHPVKGHNPRVLPISRDLIDRLWLMPKESARIFPMRLSSLRSNFSMQRKRKARELNSPRLLKLTFTSIRHWKATTEYHKTKDILHVKRLLGHKSLNSTMVYIDIERAIYGEHRDEEFTSRVAMTIEEDRELIEAGFEYVTDRDGAKIYRKRK